MNQLKRCPFCNSYETLLCNIPTGYRQIPNVWYVECLDCGCRSHKNPDKDKAIAAWNSRAERTCKQEERGWGTEGDHARVWLTCGHDCMVPTVQDLPNYCPNCGAKVVGE